MFEKNKLWIMRIKKGLAININYKNHPSIYKSIKKISLKACLKAFWKSKTTLKLRSYFYIYLIILEKYFGLIIKILKETDLK